MPLPRAGTRDGTSASILHTAEEVVACLWSMTRSSIYRLSLPEVFSVGAAVQLL